MIATVMGQVLALASVLAVALAPSAAQARWLRAETQRFVGYSDGDEAELRGYAADLTNFDQVLRLIHRVEDRELERKLEVYLVRNDTQLRRILPGASRGVLGAYEATPSGIFAVAIRHDYGIAVDEVLRHEYAHHFMLEYFPAAYPGWLIEGYAEFVSTVDVTPQAVEIGRYPKMRAGTLLGADWLPMRDVLTLPPWKVCRLNTYYGQGWLLTHYMMIDEGRARQLDAALRAMTTGTPPVQAMETATGMTLDELTTQLHRYVRSKLLYRRLTNPFPAQTPMTVTALPASADEVLLERAALGLKLKDGGKDLLSTFRARARRFPGDPLVELGLARAEIRFGDRSAAEAILQRRLAADPKDVEALRLMGESRLAAGEADPAHKAQYFKEARPFLARANAINGSDFQVLYDYAKSRSTDADHPSENTLNALLLSQQIAPSVDEIRLDAGEALLKRGRKDEAVNVLMALANSPHSGDLQARAATLIAQARGEPPPAVAAKAK